MTDDSELLRVENLVVHYGDIVAVRSISFSVAVGELVAFIGPNGAGKSTLLNAICGPLRPSAGKIFYRGRDVTTAATVKQVESGIAHVPERRQIFGPLTIQENLMLGSYARRGATSGERASDLDRIFKIFPVLAERRHDLGGSLSGGQQQMLAIGRGLMARPRLLLLDEPSLGLAPMIVREIFEVVAALVAENTSILLVEQNARAALRHAQRAIVMEGGRIVMSGDARVLRDDPKVQSAYFGKAAHP